MSLVSFSFFTKLSRVFVTLGYFTEFLTGNSAFSTITSFKSSLELILGLYFAASFTECLS